MLGARAALAESGEFAVEQSQETLKGVFNRGNLGSQGIPLPANKVLWQGYWVYEFWGMGQPRRPGGVRKNVAASVACLRKMGGF